MKKKIKRKEMETERRTPKAPHTQSPTDQERIVSAMNSLLYDTDDSALQMLPQWLATTRKPVLIAIFNEQPLPLALTERHGTLYYYVPPSQEHESPTAFIAFGRSSSYVCYCALSSTLLDFVSIGFPSIAV